MTKRISAGLFACLLFITGCSSSVSDEAFCEGVEEWVDSLTTLGNSMNDLGFLFTYADDMPSTEEVHAAATTILTNVKEADSTLPKVVNNVSDPEVAETFKEGHRLFTAMGTWMGEMARDADSAMSFSLSMMADYEELDELESAFDALDGDALDEYIRTTCPDLDDLFGF